MVTGPGLKSVGQVAFRFADCLRKTSSVLSRLSRTGCRMRPGGKRRVSQDNDPTDSHARRLDIHHSLYERVLGRGYDPSDFIGQASRSERLELAYVAFLDAARAERNRMRVAVAVGHQFVELGPFLDIAIPDEVQESMPAVYATIRTGDRVNENVAVRNERIRERGIDTVEHGRRDITLFDGAPPRDVSGISRFDPRKHALPAGRQDTVCEHEQFASRLLSAREASHSFFLNDN